VPVLAALGVLLVRSRLGAAQWLLLWTVLTAASSSTISFAPSRYDYLPLMGFWGLVVAASMACGKAVPGRGPRMRLAPAVLALVLLVVVVVYHLRLLRLEMSDYRSYGDTHRVLVEHFLSATPDLPRDRPFAFIDAGTRRAVEEAADARRGRAKSYFVRTTAIWQLVELAPLANFCGQPSRSVLRLETSTDAPEIAGVLVFTDRGFSYTDRAHTPVDLSSWPECPPVFRYQPAR
jgi:hypothetical protein